MRLIITSDLHYNHGKSRASADEVIDRINRTGGDALLVIGDTAVFDGDAFEACMTRFTIRGPRLFVAGNHELWTRGEDSHHLYTHDWPRRVEELGWHWLEGSPVTLGEVALVGSVGWYDYSFAQDWLGIPRRFYVHKISPGAAAREEQFAHLLESRDDVAPQAMTIIARWNDGRFVKLHRSDEQFLDERLAILRRDLDAVRDSTRVIAAIHHLPFRELLPPARSSQWDFAKAYLGSERIGELLMEYENVREMFCGHSHFAAEAQVGHIRAISTGSGYRAKTFHAVEW